jgi:hypothetical protein
VLGGRTVIEVGVEMSVVMFLLDLPVPDTTYRPGTR